MDTACCLKTDRPSRQKFGVQVSRAFNRPHPISHDIALERRG